MSDDIEQAQKGLEHAHAAIEGHAEHSDSGARRVAILISVLAAALALAEMQEKGAQNEYLTHHVAVSDDWAFYQAKTLRWGMQALHIDTLESLPNAADPELRKRIEAARAEQARLDDDEKTLGRKQLRARAEEQTRQREAAFTQYHHFELVVGALQIAIVLASVSVVTRMRALALAAGALGGGGALYGLAVAVGLL
jgi:hypothetical protein